jgi:TolB-like protein
MPRLSFIDNTLLRAMWAATLVAGSVCAQPSSKDQASIVVVPFEVLGGAPASLAESLRRDLAAALDTDPCITARTDREGAAPSSTYVVRGSVSAEPDRAFVALQLVEVESSKRVWFENYDYRGIGVEMMAKEIMRFLKVVAPDAVRSRITGSCSGP